LPRHPARVLRKSQSDCPATSGVPQQSLARTLAAETRLHNPAERRGWVRHQGPATTREQRTRTPLVMRRSVTHFNCRQEKVLSEWGRLLHSRWRERPTLAYRSALPGRTGLLRVDRAGRERRQRIASVRGLVPRWLPAGHHASRVFSVPHCPLADTLSAFAGWLAVLLPRRSMHLPTMSLARRTPSWSHRVHISSSAACIGTTSCAIQSWSSIASAGLRRPSAPGRSLKPRPRSFRPPWRPARCGRTAQQGWCGLPVAVSRCDQASQMSSSSTYFSPSASATSALSLSSTPSSSANASGLDRADSPGQLPGPAGRD
jgi:hypothetical protein